MSNNFKVGDFVIDYYDKVLQLHESDFKGISAKNQDWFNGLKLWAPKIGEWCWNSHVLVKVESINNDRADNLPIYSVSTPMMGESWIGVASLEPFIGKYPLFIKGL